MAVATITSLMVTLPGPTFATNTLDRAIKGCVYVVLGIESEFGCEVLEKLVYKGEQVILVSYDAKCKHIVALVAKLKHETGQDSLTVVRARTLGSGGQRDFIDKFFKRTERRLDEIICCLGHCNSFGGFAFSDYFRINFCQQVHILTCLVPFLLSRPSGRDIRVVFMTMPSVSYDPAKIDEIEI